MGAYVQDVVTFNTTAGNKAATITPAVGGYLAVFCELAADTGAVSVADNQSGTYSQVLKVVRSGAASEGFWFVRDQLVTANVAHIVTMTTDGLDSGGGLDVIEVSGITRAGLSGVRQSAHTDGIGVGLSVVLTFPGVCLTGNVVLVGVIAADNPCTVTTPTSYLLRQNIGHNVPAEGLMTNTRDSGETTTTVTWGGTETGASGCAGLELDTTPGAVARAPRPLPLPFIPRGRNF